MHSVFVLFVQMSDPLTALMHAVQVMNLLKTLITKTLRERDEAGDGGYSPSSSHSSERQSDEEEEYDSQQEMETSCESAESASDDEGRDEVESLSEIEECFLRQLNENQNAKNGFCKQLEGILCRDQESGSSPFNADSCLSVTDSRVESSFLSTSDGEDSRMSSTASGLKMAAENPPSAAIQELNDVVDDQEMVDNVVESVVMEQQLHLTDAAV